MVWGDNLSSYKHLDFFTGDSPEDLKKQLDQIMLPSHIVSIYAVNGKHYAWVNLSEPVKKKPIKKGK